MIPLYDTIRPRAFPLMTWSLILINAFVFIYEVRLAPAALRGFIEQWAIVPSQLMQNPRSEWITIFSSMFLHGGWFHLISNMWILYIFGDNVEDRMGKARYIVFYMMCGVAAATMETVVLQGSAVPVIGASGAIAGVLGAYLLLFPRARVASLLPIVFIFTLVEVPAVIFLLLWFVSQLFSGLLSFEGVGGGVAWWAHIGGFLFGALAANIFARRRPNNVSWHY